MIHSDTHSEACVYHRGDTERAFIKHFLRGNQRKFPEGGTLRKRNLGMAVQRNHKWFGNAGDKCPWWLTGKGMRMREGCGAEDLFPCQTST